MTNFSKNRNTIFLSLFFIGLIIIGSATAFSSSIWRFNLLEKRTLVFEILSILKPTMENLVLILLAQKLVTNKKGPEPRALWKQIIFYSIGISLFCWGVFISKFNLSDLFRSLFPIIFQTNKIATTAFVMVWVNKIIDKGFSLDQLSKKAVLWTIAILSIMPTILWTLKINSITTFTWGTILWGIFLLVLVKKSQKLMDHLRLKYIWFMILISTIVYILFISFLTISENHFLIFKPVSVVISHLSFLTPNIFAVLIASTIFLLIKKSTLLVKWDWLFAAILLSSHFLFSNSTSGAIRKITFWSGKSASLLLLLILFLTVLVSLLIPFFEIIRKKFDKQILNTNPQKLTTIVVASLLSLFANFILADSNSYFDVQSAFNAIRSPELMLLNVIIFFAFFMIIFVIVNRIVIASIVNLSIIIAFTFANYQKLISRNEPILPVDITSNLNNISGLLKLVNVWLVGFILIAVIVFIALSIWAEHKLKFQSIFKWWERLVILISCAVFIVFFMIKLPTVPSSSVTWKATDNTFFNRLMVKQLKYNYHPESVRTDFRRNGSALALSSRIIIPIMDKPSGYSKRTIDQISKEFEQQAVSINKNRTKNIKDQTVIYILSESFSNPQRVPEVSMKDPIPATNKLKKETTSGLMNSYGYGGGTADIEYEALTGFSLNNFAPSLSTPYVELMPKIKYHPSVLDLFKTKNAIHPFQPKFYNRINAFKQLGFDKFYNTSDPNKVKYTKAIGGVSSVDNGVGKNSKYISDKSAYQEVNRIMNKHKGGQFIQLSTMQNHMPYSKDQYGHDNPFNISGDLSANSLEKLKTYSYEINQTDKSLNNLINMANHSKQDVTIVFYGDHLPGLYEWRKNSNQKLNEYDSQLHQTDYFIYSNHSNKKVKKAVAAPYMFTPMMLEQTNSKVSPYYALLTQCMKELPAGERNKYMLANGEEVSEKNLTSKQKKLLHEYRLIQYDITAGNHYLSKGSDFFKAK